MFEQIEQVWLEEQQRAARWGVHRWWIPLGISLVTYLLTWLEKSAK